MNRKVIYYGFILLIIASYLAFIKYEEYEQNKIIVSAIKKTTISVANIIEYELNESNLTYADYFKKLESRIDDINIMLVQVESVALISDKEINKLTLEYLESSQNLIRTLLLYYKSQFDYGLANDKLENAKRELMANNLFLLSGRLKNAVTEAELELKSVEERYNAGKPRVVSAANRLEINRDKLILYTSSHNLISEVNLKELKGLFFEPM
ncbi:MAG: hypothetical protein V4545_07730 [Pseudomonadota bacterium]